MSDNGNVLGFDFGLKRIGVAVGQGITQTARPLATLKAEQGVPNWKEIQKLIDEWQASALIIGLPLAKDGSDLSVTPKARTFAVELKTRFHLPVHMTNEELSTIEARAQVFERGGYKALKKDEIDSIAAVIILEQWLGHN